MDRTNVIIIDCDKRHIESTYIARHGSYRAVYKHEVLEAVVDNEEDGKLSFVYAVPTTDKTLAKTNLTHYVTYDLQAGSIDGEIFGINWDEVKIVDGQTYSIRDKLKSYGFRWDTQQKSWVRP